MVSVFVFEGIQGMNVVNVKGGGGSELQGATKIPSDANTSKSSEKIAINHGIDQR
jgi:hypothetical protein